MSAGDKRKKSRKVAAARTEQYSKKKKRRRQQLGTYQKKKRACRATVRGGRESNLYLYIVGKACKFEGVALDDRYSAEMKRSETRGVIVLQKKKKRQQQQPAEINVMSRVKQRLGK